MINNYIVGSSPTILVKEFDHRSVEDISTNGFIIYPIYVCTTCKKTKSSLEMKDLLEMGIPLFVIRRCPVISFQKTCYTTELAELIMTLMTSELGAGQISNIIKKRRTAYWVGSARVYLEANKHTSDFECERGSLGSFGFLQPAATIIQPFPQPCSHCGGFGGTHGPSPRNIQRFFVAYNAHLTLFADRFMMSLGGQVRTHN